MTAMKTLFTTEATSKNERSETNQTPNELQNAKSRDFRVGRPSLTVYGWQAQSGRSAVRGHDESDFTQSQLG